jgi:hypothetical protein
MFGGNPIAPGTAPYAPEPPCGEGLILKFGNDGTAGVVAAGRVIAGGDEAPPPPKP